MITEELEHHITTTTVYDCTFTLTYSYKEANELKVSYVFSSFKEHSPSIIFNQESKVKSQPVFHHL